MSNIITDRQSIDELLSRSVDTVYPSPDALRELLMSGKQISAYLGIDPTADYVHLGHSTNYILLERLHKLGHRVIVLVGDFTAMIGDPSDKTAMRTQLDKTQVLENLRSYKEQIGKILDFSDTKNPIEFKFNSAWLSKLSFEKLVELASNFTVQQMLERDMFARRIAEKKPLYVHEFFYPLMQGYDSVALEVDLEVGGTDQTFNMLAGRTLARRYLNREKFVIATTLLVNPATGEKLMSKSLGTGIGLNESAEQMFGKVMAIADEGVLQTFIDCTRVPMPEIEEKKRRLEAGENPKNIKLELAHEIAAMYHGNDAADAVQKNWTSTFSTREIPEDMYEERYYNSSDSGSHIMYSAGVTPSISHARRLFEEGAVRNLDTDEKITDPNVKLSGVMRLKIGKKIFLKLFPKDK